ncbi:ParB/RepB/Spo0J family partition protein [Blautia liquoris]|uniref:ParB/RepB/Spo0J family partition protein n=1 Tax=Blautia liquoris TaxID=2779518 RepID=A0A7M2RGR5_9FIRM|nr:ParB/RepB/Spo0J family partition protein [Blautia liquoris]QOV18542.1 ParB/RepB/Spo0J family partition protein [Blautia liquoris]
MKSSAKNIKLASVDDIFSTEESRTDEKLEKIVELPLTELFPFKDHPFKVIDNEAMYDTAESIKQYGVLVPAIVRPRDEGGYEIVAGHRRKRACEIAERPTMPVIVRNLDDDAATIIMVDSNLQRENILPSERAFAFKLKLEAIKRQGARTDLTSTQDEQKLSAEKVGKDAGVGKDTVRRYIRLTELIPELLSMVDEKKIALSPAVELSYLKNEEQISLLEAMEMEQATPSQPQAKRLREFSEKGKLTIEVMSAIMSEEKKGDLDKVTLTADKIKKYFPKSYTPRQMEDTIIKLLEGWHKKRTQQQER